jgi:hypothetical protein
MEGSSNSSDSSNRPPIGAIVGGVVSHPPLSPSPRAEIQVGGVCFIALVGAAIWFFIRRKRFRSRSHLGPAVDGPRTLETDDDSAGIYPSRSSEDKWEMHSINSSQPSTS